METPAAKPDECQMCDWAHCPRPCAKKLDGAAYAAYAADAAAAAAAAYAARSRYRDEMLTKVSNLAVKAIREQLGDEMVVAP